MLKKAAVLCLSLMLMISLCACNKGMPRKDMANKFINYYQNELESEHHGIVTPSGTTMYLVSLTPSSVDSVKKAVVMNVTPNEAGAAYEWISKSDEERKQDLQYIGKMFLDMCEDKNWGTGFTFYVTVMPIYGHCSVVYHYEKDEMWVPKLEDTFKELYEKYQTFDLDTLRESEESGNYLVSKGLAENTKDGIKLNSNTSYFVEVSQNGAFEAGKQDESEAR